MSDFENDACVPDDDGGGRISLIPRRHAHDNTTGFTSRPAAERLTSSSDAGEAPRWVDPHLQPEASATFTTATGDINVTDMRCRRDKYAPAAHVADLASAKCSSVSGSSQHRSSPLPHGCVTDDVTDAVPQGDCQDPSTRSSSSCFVANAPVLKQNENHETAVARGGVRASSHACSNQSV